MFCIYLLEHVLMICNCKNITHCFEEDLNEEKLQLGYKSFIKSVDS